jgi:hypothetical protein
MRRILLMAGLVGLLGACASATPVYGPDGKPYARIECNGAIQTLNACYEKALQICPNGYVLADEKQRTMGAVSARESGSSASSQRTSGGGMSQGTARSASYGYGFGAAPIYRHIVVACK